MIGVQPSGMTSVRFVQSSVEPPSLVVFDGTTTLIVSPAALFGGLTEAAAFGRCLAAVATEWAQGCEDQVMLSESADPLDIAGLVGQLTPPGAGGGGGDGD